MTWREDVSDQLALRSDARQLRFAAEIIRDRAPRRFMGGVLARVLEGFAGKLDQMADSA